MSGKAGHLAINHAAVACRSEKETATAQCQGAVAKTVPSSVHCQKPEFVK